MLLSLLFLIFISANLTAQPGDFIAVKKKNGITVKSYYSGSTIKGTLKSGIYFEGKVQLIANDTLSILWYTVPMLATPWGTLMPDTIGWNITKINYNEIGFVELPVMRNRKARLLSCMSIISGLGYGGLNTINTLREGGRLFSNNNKKALTISGGLIGLGFLIQKFFVTPQKFNSKKHKIVYISLQPEKDKSAF